MNSGKKSKSNKLAILAVVAIVLVGGLFWLRKEAGGIHNALSVAYWYDRFFGLETYKPEVAYFMRGSRKHRDVCFTFDDGPHESSAAEILDALKNEGLHATFFVVGIRVKQHPELVKRMIDEGNEVGNHTQDHLRLDTLPIKNVRAEIENCATNIERACGRRPALLRPPGMRFKHDTLLLAKRMGYTTVGWNVGAKDFVPKASGQLTPEEIAEIHTTPDEVAQRVIDNVKPGEIILLHDNPVTARALPKMFAALKKDGYQIKTVTQMLAELDPPVIIDPDPVYKGKLTFPKSWPKYSSKT
ncbi:MAG: polysaccharide deacetylase family protein [Fimbriimonas sp.]|nr:polysaccharide deacetylase family protein [Fimbriimonas sp.]